MSAASRIYQGAVPTPLYRAFDYVASVSLVPGARVRVPFGRRELVGVVVGEAARAELPLGRLKAITAVLDTGAVIPPNMLKLLQWAADYYHHPLRRSVELTTRRMGPAGFSLREPGGEQGQSE